MAEDPFVGEIAIFAGNFAPRGWAFCEGQIISIAQNTALFAIIGTTYGGNGTTTFALPNLTVSAGIGAGNGPGLTPRSLGEEGGVDEVTLLESEMPAHSHPASLDAATTNRPVSNLPAVGGRYSDGIPGLITAPHENRPPSLTLSFIIALQGVFPPRP